ncbi:ATP-grasp domain-containing protein [Streptomyces sp. NPDC018029]|uniref:ATP-grasp domain-containing protein n=1 Tax=Streptomyces sp. NPDC018029 TaxID=3365032 RepID=UPI003798C65B
MCTPGPAVLLAPHPRSSTAVLLTEAAVRRGLRVSARLPVAPPGPGPAVHWYGGPLAADRVAGRAGIALLEPADGWLAALPYDLTCRRVESTTLGEARRLRRAAFVKPPSEKSFPAAVYPDGSRLPPPDAAARVTDDAAVLVCDVVDFAAEYRCFVLDGRVVTGSRYAVRGLLGPGPLSDGARAFAGRVLAHCAGAGPRLPRAVVLDVGVLADGRWAVVEANMAWFAIYAADPDRVLDVVLAATGPPDAVAPADRPFLRFPPDGQPS